MLSGNMKIDKLASMFENPINSFVRLKNRVDVKDTSPDENRQHLLTGEINRWIPLDNDKLFLQ